MVRCNRIDGHPCRCDLADPRVKRLINVIIKNMMKLLMNTITREDRIELRVACRTPHAKQYLKFYLEHLERLYN